MPPSIEYDESLVVSGLLCENSTSNKPFPTTSNALVVRHLVIHQTASDVVLGFIRWACGHPPDDDPDPIAGVTGWALSLHETKLLRVTDKFD